MGKSVKSRATVICHRHDKVLLVRKAEAKWTLPGGKIELDEGPLQAALRELCEETGLTREALEFLALHEFERRAHHVFRVDVPEPLAARPQNEIAECRWFSREDLSGNAVKRPCRELLDLYFRPAGQVLEPLPASPLPASAAFAAGC